MDLYFTWSCPKLVAARRAASAKGDAGRLALLREEGAVGLTHLTAWVENAAGKLLEASDVGGKAQIPVGRLGELQEQLDRLGRVPCGVGRSIAEADAAHEAAAKRGACTLAWTPALAAEHDQPEQPAEAEIEKAEAAPAQVGQDDEAQSSLYDMLARHPADQVDPADELHQLAGRQAERDAASGSQAAQRRQQVRQQVGQLLVSLRRQAPQAEQLKAQAPEVYQTLVQLTQAVASLGAELGPTAGLGKSEGLAKMAYANNQYGQHDGHEDFPEYDYGHLLKPEHREAGYELTVEEQPRQQVATGPLEGLDMPAAYKAYLTHNGKVVGHVRGDLVTNRQGETHLNPHSQLGLEHRGSGLGKIMYEAVFTHAYHNGVEQVRGEASEDAAKVHLALADKHGIDGDYDYEPSESWRYRYALKSELSKKLADIPVGAQRHGVYNYSHVLRPDQRAAGYSLEVHHAPGAPAHLPKPQGLLARMLGRKPVAPTPQPRTASRPLDVKLLHRGREVGSLTTHLRGKDLGVQEAKINPGHRGQEAGPQDPRRGLGSAMYDAGLAHARNVAGARYVVGGEHSSMASRAHQAVARRHGLDYTPEAAAVPVAKPGAYDGAFKPYSYALKTEWDAGLHKSDIGKPITRTVGADFPDRVLHGTTGKSARAFVSGTDLPEAQRQRTLSEFGDNCLYVSEPDAPHQALMFGQHGGKGYGGRQLLEMKLRPGAKIADLTEEMSRVPFFGGGREATLTFNGRPRHTDDMAAWLNEKRAARGLPPADPTEFVDPTHPKFLGDGGSEYPSMLAHYLRDRGYHGFRLADETVILDSNAVAGARRMKPDEVRALADRPRRSPPRAHGSLYSRPSWQVSKSEVSWPLVKGFGHLPIPHAPQRTFLHLPVGTVDASTGKFLITSKEGRRIWKQGRMGVIRSREPATPAGGYGRPTSSRNPGS